MKRSFGCLCLTLILSVGCFAQSGDLTLKTGASPHAGLDDVYRQFSESYRTLNVNTVANLYTENAAYLVPDDDVMTGREPIRASFTRFFDSVRDGGRTMTIAFEIVQRRVEKNIGYDVGIYTLRTFKDGKEIGSGQGKFVVVAIKEKDGKWRFQVDGYSDLKPKTAK